MPSDNVGKKRLDTDDQDIPAELPKREAQDRAKATPGHGGAESPVDSMHVDAPTKRGNDKEE